MKYFISASLVILIINASIAQTKLGLQLTSSVISQRVTHSNDSIGISDGSNSFNPSIALLVDMPISGKYFFSTGIGYISKRVNLNVIETYPDSAHTKSYSIQYIQLPATFKLYTDDIALDKKLYFQFGPIIEIPISFKEKDQNFEVIKTIQPIDVTLLLGLGIEIQIAPQTAIGIGISYRRGLVNIVKETEFPDDNLVIKNDLIGIDIIIKL
jgi:hypothetical protein